MNDDVELALRLADRAAEIARPLFEAGVSAGEKADGTPVTVADLAVGRELIRILTAERPADAILSEEAGSSGKSHRRWLIDPIDGTEKFVDGDSCWGTHIALELNGKIELGVMTRPTRKQRWWAARGLGACRCEEGTGDGVLLQVSETSNLATSRISVWSEGTSPVSDELVSLATLIEPTYDDYIDIIEGRLEAIIFPRPGVAFAWDHAPSVVLIAEAGGHFRDPDGGERIVTGSGVFSYGRVDIEMDPVVFPLFNSQGVHDIE